MNFVETAGMICLVFFCGIGIWDFAKHAWAGYQQAEEDRISGALDRHSGGKGLSLVKRP